MTIQKQINGRIYEVSPSSTSSRRVVLVGQVKDSASNEDIDEPFVVGTEPEGFSVRVGDRATFYVSIPLDRFVMTDPTLGPIEQPSLKLIVAIRCARKPIQRWPLTVTRSTPLEQQFLI